MIIIIGQVFLPSEDELERDLRGFHRFSKLVFDVTLITFADKSPVIAHENKGRWANVDMGDVVKLGLLTVFTGGALFGHNFFEDAIEPACTESHIALVNDFKKCLHHLTDIGTC